MASGSGDIVKKGTPKEINLGRSLDFNKLTTSLAAVGFVYVEEKFGSPDHVVELLLLIVLLAVFAFSFVMGIMVFGVGAGFSDDVKDTSDEGLKSMGRRHSFSLIVGLAIVGTWLVVAEFIEFGDRTKPELCDGVVELKSGVEMPVRFDCSTVVKL